MSVILILLYISAVILGIIIPRSKVVLLYMFAVSWIIFAGNYSNPDLENYAIRFGFGLDSIKTTDIGFDFFCQLFLWMGLDFYQWKLIIAALSLLVIFGIVYKYAKSYNTVLSFFLISTYFTTMIALRNLVAFSFVLIGIPFLIKGTKKDYVIYAIAVIVGSMIHISAAFYFLFLFVKIKKRMLFIFVSVIALFLLKNLILGTYAAETDSEKGIEYSGRISTFAAILFSGLLLLSSYYFNRITDKWKKRLLSNKNESYIESFTEEKQSYHQMQIVAAINSILVILIPMFFDNLIYIRLVENVVFINLILLANSFQFNSSKMLLNMFVYSFFWALYLYLTRFDYIVEPFFKFNTFLV